MILSGANNSYNGNTTVSGGTLTLTSTGALSNWNSSGKLSVAAATTLAVSAGGTWTGTNIDTLLTNNSTGFSASGGLLGIDTGAANFSYTPATPIGTYQAGMGLNKPAPTSSPWAAPTSTPAARPSAAARYRWPLPAPTHWATGPCQ